ncbi:response regulator [Natrinema sp. 74]|uniref:response regulator n=1 Tax=Natrinema sp. 74 TaxID=3384159 RepID=UPI0038D440BD
MDEGAETDVEILLVEDNPGDVRLIKEALDETNSTLHITSDGREALDFLHRRNEFTDAPRIDIILLDLNLPKVDGRQVLDEIRNDSELDDIRVIIVTSAQEEHTTFEQGELDVSDFLTKPANPEEFMALVRSSIFD